MRLALIPMAALVLSLLGCSSTPPPAWASGGTRLVIGDASWKLADGDVTLRGDGHVTVDGSAVFSIDVAGRVYDDDGDPAAVLLPEGQLVGTDDMDLGRVGVTNASPPGAVTAWLSVLPDGTVLLFDSDGERRTGGRWTGCSGPRLRACTLVTHLVALRHAASAQRSGMSFGVGIGVFR